MVSGHSDSLSNLDVVGLVDVQNGFDSLREIGLAYNASRSAPTVRIIMMNKIWKMKHEKLMIKHEG